MKLTIYLNIAFIFFYTTLRAQNVNNGNLIVTPGTVLSSVSSFTNNSTGNILNNGQFYFFNNFENNGSFNFTPGSQGTTLFTGNQLQALSGSNTSFFYNLVLDNSFTSPFSFSLSSAFSISNNANLINGILNNRAFGGTFIFEDNATVSSVSNTCFVDGIVDKIGNEGFSFPIGNEGFYRNSIISSPNAVTDYFISSYALENPDNLGYSTTNLSGNIEIVDNAEYWVVEKVAGNTDVALTLTWDTSTTPSNIITGATNTSLRVVRWDENLQVWVDEGGIVDDVNRTVTTLTNLSSYGVFTLGRVREIIDPVDVEIYNSVTPNGDGLNDYFFISNINLLPNNEVSVFNRWGAEVFSTKNYDSNGNVFKGAAQNGIGSGLLPTGTYFYVITYDNNVDGNIQKVEKAGYLYLITE